MKNSRLTFNSSTNFTLPIGTYQILKYDAYYYGYIKNDVPNISGFLNDLIPALSDYQNDLYTDLLKYNNGNMDIAKAVARSVYNVYLKPFTFHGDGTVNVPFRISKDRYNDFETIHDERLFFYDTSFTNYIRTLLVEYTSKTFTQRECLYAFRELKIIRQAVEKSKACKIYHDKRCDIIVPVSIESSPVYSHNFVVGVTTELKPIAIRLRDVRKITFSEDKVKITPELCELITEYLDKIYEEEYKECSE